MDKEKRLELADIEYCNEMVNNAGNDTSVAKEILERAVVDLRADLKLPKPLQQYLANCIEQILESANPREAFNLKFDTAGRRTDSDRDELVALLMYEKCSSNISKAQAARAVKEELALPLSQRQVVNIYEENIEFARKTHPVFIKVKGFLDSK